MKIYKILACLISILILSACGANSENAEENELFEAPQENLEELEQIDSGIINALTEAGYTTEHASKIQEILNTVGVESIEIENMSGQPEEGLNAVVCYPNGYTEEDRKFFFTTENGTLFYAGFSGEDLYDSESGGFLKDYSDVHVPEKEITVDVYEELRTMATEEVKKCLNNPDSADFKTLEWGIGRSGDKYQVIGMVSAKNGFGVEKEIPFSVWFISDTEGYFVEGVSLDGVRVK